MPRKVLLDIEFFSSEPNYTGARCINDADSKCAPVNVRASVRTGVHLDEKVGGGSDTLPLGSLSKSEREGGGLSLETY